MTIVSRRVELVTIGDELLLGYTIDTNAAHLARALASIGMHIVRRTTVGDTPEEIATAVREALDRTGAVITTGGLGPTSDDLTKPSIAAIFGRGMHLDEAHVAWMEERWRTRFGRPLPASNKQQAMIPDGARKLENHHGSAPGIWLEDERGRWVAMLPGVPREMRGMLADTLLPLLRDRVPADSVVRSLTLRTTGVGESLLADRIEAMTGGPLGVTLAYLPSIAGVDLRLTVREMPGDEADARLASAAARLRECVGDAIYGEGDADLAAVVLDLCRAGGMTVGVAESCTGGLLGARLTAIPGSSDVVRGGVIAYHNDLKRGLLGVDPTTLEEHGAVSEPVVRQMAAGARSAARATIGIAITGVAGPTGGTPEKPVGTVWIAADVNGEVETKLLKLWGDREEIRQRSAQWTMELLRQRLVASSRAGRD
ncbi:MAG TPA: competence/damage-inducible protein A [Gemmatimonadaceae bacterium]|nr:competence/damage-inducible protein A [Gemmatimonadaceae bacterium]